MESVDERSWPATVAVEVPVVEIDRTTYYRYVKLEESQRREGLIAGTEKELQERILRLDDIIEHECRPTIATLRKQISDAGMIPNG